ncbi:MAG: alpha/beta hydrolase fold domain-containing protein [Phycisphaerae bacterium]
MLHHPTTIAAAAIALVSPAAATTIAPLQIDANITYATRNDIPLHLDIYLPPGHSLAEKRPAILMLHGGAWEAGSRKDLAAIAKGCALAGFIAIPVDYRLATPSANKFPAQLDDVQTAVRWIRAHAAQYGIDPDKLGAWGHSAGGHLAALLGTEDTRDNSDKSLANFSSSVQAVVDLSGPSLFLNAPETNLTQQALAIVTNFLGKPPDQVPDLATLASPALHIDDKTAPILLVHGTADPLVPLSQALLFYNKLKAHHRDATLLQLPNEGHSYSPAANQQWITESLIFFREKLKS